MALKIRFRQQGSRNRQTFRLVVTDSRTRRDGKYCDVIGSYNPSVEANNFKLDVERLNFWLSKGAQISEGAETLIAKAAPEVIKELNAKKHEKRQKLAAKRRTLKQKKTGEAPKKKEVKKAAPAKAAATTEEAPAKKAKAPAKRSTKKKEA